MKRIDITDWCDYVRGLGDEESREAMARSLEGGDAEAESMAAALRRVAADAASEARHQPPDWAVRSVHAYFGLQQPAETSSMRRLTPRLAFDSALAPLPEGTRTLEASIRQLVYYAQDFAISLQLDYSGRGRGLTLGGEILHRETGAVPSVPALLMSGEEVVSRSITGDLGEFSMNSEAEIPLRLCLMVGDREMIEVRLDRPRTTVGGGLDN